MARLPKWPKRPKKTASMQAWLNYEKRNSATVARRKALREKPNKIQAIIDKTNKVKF